MTDLLTLGVLGVIDIGFGSKPFEDAYRPLDRTYRPLWESSSVGGSSLALASAREYRTGLPPSSPEPQAPTPVPLTTNQHTQ